MSFYSEASLAYVASAGAGKDGKAYSMKPVDGTGDFTFSRGSNLAATRVGPTGLIEKGRENLLLQSNAFTTFPWLQTDATATIGQSGYDGTNNAWLIDKSGANGRVRQLMSSTGVLTTSVYAKAGTNDWLRISFANFAYFDLANGVIGNTNAIDTTITSVGNGWYRCTMTVNSTSIQYANYYPAEDDNVISGTSGNILMQSIQIESGLAATEVIESGATTGKAGLLEDEPRFDYSGGATCPSLLLEPSRTNLVKYSEYLGSADWGAFPTSDPVTHTQNYAIAPDGTQTASLLGNFTSGGFNIVNNSNYRTSTLATQNPLDDTYTMSVWLKTTSGTGTISLLNRGLSSGTNSVQTLQCNVTNEWKKFDLSNTYTAAENASSLGFIIIKTNTDTLEEVLVWGAQMEQGSYPTSYIPNHSGGTITRGDDLGSVGDYIGSTITFGPTDNFSIFYDGEVYQADRMIIGGGDSGLNAGRLWIRETEIRLDGTTPSVSKMADTSVVVDLNTRFKLLVKRNGATIDFFLDGNKLTTTQGDTDATFVINSLFWSFNNVYTAFGRHNQLLVLPTALSDADCITLTTL